MATIMIKRGDDGRTLLMIGLEPENVEKIQEGHPFMHTGRIEYGFPLAMVDVMIFQGTTEEIQKKLREDGINVKRIVDYRPRNI